MTNQELKVAAAAKIEEINTALVDNEQVVNVPPDAPITDQRIARILGVADRFLSAQPLRKPHTRRLARFRELFTRFIAA